jgi:hypothetical protein
VNGDPSRDIRILQHPERFDMVIKAGRKVDTMTPIPERRVWSFERHKTYLSGYYQFDPETETGVVKQ